ncbi:MAG: hypothetical protein PUB21_04725 [Bacteroidales bacterium]|nr:hypothetical protein [Bacteroidales bacterium]
MSEKFYNTLVQSLRLVASPADIQIKSLPDFVCIADEIALTYDETYVLLPQIAEEDKRFTPQVMETLKELDRLFGEMSEDKTLWDIDQLKENLKWEKSRLLAYEALQLLGEPYEFPDLGYISYVRG